MATPPFVGDAFSVPASPLNSSCGHGSPLFSSSPTLRPSLRERHDYVLALLADGTLVVWLLLGLSAFPRCTPKVVVWANLPQVTSHMSVRYCIAHLRCRCAGDQVIPRTQVILSCAAFCHFAAPSFCESVKAAP